MKRTLVVFLGLFLSICSDDHYALVKKSIVHYDVKKLKELLETGEDVASVIEEIKDKKEELVKLAERTEFVQEAKDKLGEKKYTKWKRIGFGGACVGYAGLKLILGSVFQSDDLDSSENEGFFSYDRVTDLGIGLNGLSWIYWGVTGRNPNDKFNDAIEIKNLLTNKLPDQSEE